MAKESSKTNDKEIKDSNTPLVLESVEKETKEIIGCLVSRLDSPEYITYMNESLVISPREKINKVNKSGLLFPLPKGIVFVENGG